jgi:hypothetical protein
MSSLNATTAMEEMVDISTMEKAKDKSDLELVVDDVKTYIGTSFELSKLELIEQTSNAASQMVSGTLIAFLLLFAMFILSIGLSFFLSAFIGYTYSGFGIVGGIYLLIAIILILFKNSWIDMPMRNKIIQAMLHKRNP